MNIKKTMEIKEIRKPNYFKCKICGLKFYVPYNVYTVNCPCGSTGYSEKNNEEVSQNYEESEE